MISIVTALKNPQYSLLNQQLEHYREIFSLGISFEWVIQANNLDAEILKKLKSYEFISIDSAVDSGIYAAWNSALKRIKGDKVCFLGIDDTPTRDWLTFADSYILNEFEMLTTNVAMQNHSGNHLNIRLNPDGGVVNLGQTPYSHPGIIFSNKLFINRFFLEKYRIVSDGLFYSSVGVLEIKGFFAECGVSMRVGGISNSRIGSRNRFKELILALVNGDVSCNPRTLGRIGASFPAFALSYFPHIYIVAQKLRWVLYNR